MLLVQLVLESWVMLTSGHILGEKTKWVPIPAKELQAAADEVARARHIGPNAKKHSPRGNGRTRRLHDDSLEKQNEPVSGRGEKPSPVNTGNTRHDRKGSLNVPSSGSSRRVSPLQLSTNLPSPANNQDPSQAKVLSETHELSQTSSPRREPKTTIKHANVPGQRNESSPSAVTSSLPSNAQPPAPAETLPQNTQQAPPVAYSSPMWSNVVHSQPFYPSYPVYPVNPPVAEHTPNPSNDPPATQPAPRQKRKTRPNPKDASPLAGYRGNTPETLAYASTEAQPFKFIGDGAAESLSIDASGDHEDKVHPSSTPELRGAWWSIGIDGRLLVRWLKRHHDLQKTAFRPDTLKVDSNLIFLAPAEDDLSMVNTSQIENAILQGVTAGTAPTGQPGYTDVYVPSWPAPGTGPSALDIGLATGVSMTSGTHRVPPPPLYVGMPIPHPHMPTAMPSPHTEWTARNDPYAIQPPMHGYPYTHYPHSYTNSPATENMGQTKTPYTDGSGRGRWREDRYPRGRGRGFSRGRGHRGFGGPRPYNSQYNSSGNANQASHTVNTPTFPNPPTVYIPEPMLHPSYPYSANSPSQFFSGYTPSTSFPEPATTTTSSQGRPPSPIPITQLHYPMEKLQYKLLGQVLPLTHIPHSND